MENILPVNIETWGQGGSQRGIPSKRSRDFDNTMYSFQLAKFRPSTVADPKSKYRFRMRRVCLVGPRHKRNVEANGSCVQHVHGHVCLCEHTYLATHDME